MKNLIVFLFIFLSSYAIKAQTQCMYFFTITPGFVPATATLGNFAKFSWDTSDAVYSSNTTTSIQIIESDGCTWTETSPIQSYPISNFFNPAIGSIAINFDTIGSRCFRWRLVNQGRQLMGQIVLQQQLGRIIMQ